MQHSEWMQPTEDEVRELEYTQLEDGNGKGSNGNGNTTTIPINGGIWIILLVAVIYGLWKQYRTSQHSTSES